MKNHAPPETYGSSRPGTARSCANCRSGNRSTVSSRECVQKNLFADDLFVRTLRLLASFLSPPLLLVLALPGACIGHRFHGASGFAVLLDKDAHHRRNAAGIHRTHVGFVEKALGPRARDDFVGREIID